MMKTNVMTLAWLVSSACAGATTAGPSSATAARLGSSAVAVSGASPSPASDPDEDFPDDWFDGLPSADARVSAEEAKAFVQAVFALVDRKIFDPAFKKAERDAARAALLASIHGDEQRAPLAERVATALRHTGMSHLDLWPAETMKHVEALMAPATAERSVSVEHAGDIAILHIKTFLVPGIRRESVDRAFAEAKGAKALLIDVRHNGGGSVSSVVYTLDHLIGPGKAIMQQRSRRGVDLAVPYVQSGPLPDAENAASAADTALGVARKYVEWRTSLDAPAPFAAPVYALTDTDCASGCDEFAAALRCHHAAKLLGATTVGARLGAVVFRPPWKGYAVLVPIDASLTPDGQLLDGVGVEPDVAISACASLPAPGAPDPCRAAALDLIRKDLASPGGRP